MASEKKEKEGVLALFDLIRRRVINFITSRSTCLMLIVIALSVILVKRCFELQIVHGQEYLDEFILKTQKTRDISSARGNIYDRNGNLLAYNELAYSVKLEDVYESGSQKNANLNATIYKLIQMLEKSFFIHLHPPFLVCELKLFGIYPLRIGKLEQYRLMRWQISTVT